MQGKRVSQSRVTLTQLMGPQNANTLGNVHGGIIMKMCDEAGGMAATKHSQRPAVTVAVDSMTFHSPVNIGDLLTVSAELSWVGRTSMEVRTVVTAEDVLSGQITHTNTAFFVYVALDERGRPTPVPPLVLETEEEKARFERGAWRQDRRLEQRRHT
jgi:acyl-CoA hydrolase